MWFLFNFPSHRLESAASPRSYTRLVGVIHSILIERRNLTVPGYFQFQHAGLCFVLLRQSRILCNVGLSASSPTQLQFRNKGTIRILYSALALATIHFAPPGCVALLMGCIRALRAKTCLKFSCYYRRLLPQ
jgi:hypothetical protein